jgi:hypothetical protein
VVQSVDPSFARASIGVMEEWMVSSHPPRKVYNIGPQLPSGSTSSSKSGDLKQSPEFAKILSFMNTTLESHGPGSLIYVGCSGFTSVFQKS